MLEVYREVAGGNHAVNLRNGEEEVKRKNHRCN